MPRSRIVPTRRAGGPMADPSKADRSFEAGLRRRDRAPDQPSALSGWGPCGRRILAKVSKGRQKMLTIRALVIRDWGDYLG